MLIGAHSYGQFHAGNSMFKYSWTRDQTKYLNNQVIKRPDTQKHADDADIDAYFFGDGVNLKALLRLFVVIFLRKTVVGWC